MNIVSDDGLESDEIELYRLIKNILIKVFDYLGKDMLNNISL